MKRPYYVTSPIYYVNDKPHIGHAYTSVACDVMARFKRLDGYDVTFLTGTDEHGQKVAASAAKAGMEPQAFTDKVSQTFRDLSQALNLSNDDFIRTTQERHHKACEVFWKKLEENGQIYLGAHKGWYAVRDEAFYDESELRESNGKKIAPSGAECSWTEEPCYYFPLSKWKDRLLKYFDENPDFIFPHSRRAEVINMTNALDELKENGEPKYDLPISRSRFKWGIPVPNDPDHVMYVWIDALANYVTGVGYPDTESEIFKNKWPADVHMIGKDILKFHTIYWPAFLMAAGMEPPKRVFAHGWWTNEGQKISKSLGNTIDPLELIHTYGLDQTRYFMMRAVSFGKDGNFSRKTMIECINGNLSNKLGNLAQRTLSMINKDYEAHVPHPGQLTKADEELLRKAQDLSYLVRQEFEVQAFNKALDYIWNVVDASNRYMDEQSPWSLKKTDPERSGTVLYVLAETLRHIAVLTQPVMPDSMEKLLDQLAVPAEQRCIACLNSEEALKGGAMLPQPEPIFPRYAHKPIQRPQYGFPGGAYTLH